MKGIIPFPGKFLLFQENIFAISLGIIFDVYLLGIQCFIEEFLDVLDKLFILFREKSAQFEMGEFFILNLFDESC